MSPISKSACIARFASASPVLSTPVTTGWPSSTAGIIADSTVSPWPVAPTSSSEASSILPPPQQGMELGTKLALGMIPAVLGLCAMWIFFLIWWPKRKARKARKASQQARPPPVPEKDVPPVVPATNSKQRVSKAFNVAAFSTPIQGRCREVQVRHPSKKSTKTVRFSAKHEINTTTTTRLATSKGSRPPSHSPIDGTSPFRLKRGDTTVRKSLGSEISSLWPSPPPSVWVKRPQVTERLHSPPVTPQSSFSRHDVITRPDNSF